MDELNWGVMGFVVIALVLGGIAGYILSPTETTGLSDAEINAKINNAVERAVAIKDTEIERLLNLRGEPENEINETEDEYIESEKVSVGYLIDELYLSTSLSDTYSDREVKTLFDGEIRFDGKNYDAEETLILEDIELLANENDFEGNIYMTVPNGAIEYKFEFEDDLDTSLIDEDETLNFEFLGEDYELSNWDDDEVTLTKGIEHKLLVGESFVVGEKVVTLYAIDESGEKASIMVEGEEKVFVEGQTKTINEIEIKVKTIFDSVTSSYVMIFVGEDIEVTIESGEEYEEDSIWNWNINANSIGLILNEDFTEIDKDGDEEFPAIEADNKFCLINDYVCIQFNGMDEEDTEEYNLELDQKSGNEYVQIEGNFQKGTKDYNRVYVNSTGIYNKDLDLIDNNEIELTDTDSVLERTANWIIIEDFKVNYDLNSSESNGNVLDSKDEDWLTDFGIKIMDPENSVDDQEFEISVPEEKISGSINLI